MNFQCNSSINSTVLILIDYLGMTVIKIYIVSYRDKENEMDEWDQTDERVRDLEIIEREWCVQGQSVMFFIHLFVMKTCYICVLVILLR